jgi:hypothetical protein
MSVLPCAWIETGAALLSIILGNDDIAIESVHASLALYNAYMQ